MASSWARAWRSSSCFRSFIDPSNLDEFSREVTLLHKLKHPHVLTFYGISRRDVYCFIVTEYCPYALDAILSGGRVADDVLRGANGKPRQTPRLTVAARTTILYQVALALQYLHAERVLHHDLKPGNILLDRDFTAKVSDFGLAQLVADTEDVVSKGPTKAPRRMSAGATAVYAAPEMLLKLEEGLRIDRTEEKFLGFYRDMSDSGRESGQLRRVVGSMFLRMRLCVLPSFHNAATRTIFMLRMLVRLKRGKRTSRMLSETKGCGPRFPPPCRRSCGRSWSGAGRRSLLIDQLSGRSRGG